MENYILRKSIFVDTFYVRFDEFDGKKLRLKIFPQNTRLKIFPQNTLSYIGVELTTYHEAPSAKPIELGSELLPIVLSLLANK